MHDLLKSIFRHKIALLVIVFILLIITVGIPLMINWLYKQSALAPFFATEWGAADALSYYGSVLTFLGTAALSTLSLWQNHQIKVGNDKHSALLEQMEKARNAIYFKIQVESLLFNASNAKIVIQNRTENIAYNLSISELQIINNIDNAVFWKAEEEKTCDHLGAFMKWELELNNSEIPGAEYCIKFIISYADKYGKTYKLRATGLWDNAKQKLHFEIAEVR